ncbi:hypothetical protein [Pseudomonas asplenii]|uniref:hypothetical protein n=1 Tax=Pseudomonas asplenii TaxID=53407 RepID=UPI00235F591B|nr:hypothetical protein [Pseudomonas asplenii]
MGQLTYTLKTSVSWWVRPLLWCTGLHMVAMRKSEPSLRAIDWIVRHGMKVEIL